MSMEAFYKNVQRVKVNESKHIALFVLSGSLKNLFSIDCASIYFSQYYFLQILLGGEMWDYPALLVL